LYGDSSHHLVSLTAGKSSEEKHKILSDFFQPYISLLPNFSFSDPEHKVKAILLTRWQEDPHSGFGSYCNFQIGSKDSKGDVEVIRHGCPERRLWFCGEHTSSFDNLGSVNGAYVSGESVGQRIMDLYPGFEEENIETEEENAKNKAKFSIWKWIANWVRGLGRSTVDIWSRVVGTCLRPRRKRAAYEEV
jgi:uncharacterized protein YuzB (UPF0349 family)